MLQSKNILLAFFAAIILLTSCSTTNSTFNVQSVDIEKFRRDDYVVLDKVKGQAKSVRFWLLFIPISGKTPEPKLDARAYRRAVKSADKQDADGLLAPRRFLKKTTYPFLLFNWTTSKVTIEGKPFRLKNEEEYQETKRYQRTTSKN